MFEQFDVSEKFRLNLGENALIALAIVGDNVANDLRSVTGRASLLEALRPDNASVTEDSRNCLLASILICFVKGGAMTIPPLEGERFPEINTELQDGSSRKEFLEKLANLGYLTLLSAISRKVLDKDFRRIVDHAMAKELYRRQMGLPQ